MLELNDENFRKEVLENPPSSRGAGLRRGEGEQLVLVDFWRPGCGPCLKMDSVIEEVAKEFKGRVGVGKLNIFESPEIAKKYGVPATPTFIIFKNGEPIERAVGVRSKQALIDKLNSLFI